MTLTMSINMSLYQRQYQVIEFMNKKHSQSLCRQIYELQSLYEGQISTSYNKQGFGLFMNTDFDFYAGFWKNNCLHGLGLLFLHQKIIYGYFKNGGVNGIAILNNPQKLVCGVFQNNCIQDIGFEYEYHTQVWKMNKYYKGISIQTLKQEFALPNETPQMLSIDFSLLLHYTRYLSQNYFASEAMQKKLDQTVEQIQALYFDKKDNILTIGRQSNQEKNGEQKQIEGLYLKFQLNRKQVMEVGSYKEGELQGYAYLQNLQNNEKSRGRYLEGRRDGIFIMDHGEGPKFVLYRRGVIVGYEKNAYPKFQKEMKIYNFRQKSYLSSKTKINTLDFNYLFLSSDKKLALMKQKKSPQKHSNQQQKKSQNMTFEYQTKRSPSQSPPQSPRKNQPRNPDNFNLSSVQIIKNKMNILASSLKNMNKTQLIKVQKNKRKEGGGMKGMKMREVKEVQMLHQMKEQEEEEFDQSIAQEEQMFAIN